jgi:DNA-binding SARP family transcriptional activator/tetratricopeptide (TPR) repeat protein
VQFRVLGPFEIEADDGRLYPLARRQERCVLAILLLDPGRMLPVDRLCQLLWDDNPPQQARRAVHAHIAHIRAVLAGAGGTAEVVSDRNGYLMKVDPDTVDAHRFRSLAEQASLTSDLDERDRLLREALALWRGPALHNVATTDRLRQQLCADLDEQHLQAIEASVATGLELGRHREKLPELAKLTAEYPARERLAELHMLALHRNGGTAEALAVYRRFHARLADELGLDPGPALQQLHQAILRGKPVPSAPALPPVVRPRRPHPSAAPERPSVDRLASLVEHDPLSEELVADLMRALAAAGRRVEALASFRAIRRLLADQLGVEPGPELQRLHQAILRGEVRTAPDLATVPRQLPPDVRRFTGRVRELEELSTVAGIVGGARVAVITGTAGVGKTTIAVHWAHRVSRNFPGGQFYVNLRGFDPIGDAMEPDEALHGFLDALGVPARRMPAARDARTALFRSLLADRRALVLLDNARDAEQVRPLLPGSAGCLVVVTSRNQLAGLVVAEGAHLLGLDVLTVAEARSLLASRLGPDRVAGNLEPVAAIIAACARLPLALAIVAARASTSREQPLTGLAAELSTGNWQDRLDALATPDRAADIREVLSWSYYRLRPDTRRLFRMLGLHPGPHVRIGAAASLAGLPAARTRPLLAELISANLAAQHDQGRYIVHDLLRGYAAELTEQEDTEPERRRALSRLFDHYLHTSSNAALRLAPGRDPIELAPPEPHSVIDELTDEKSANAWLSTERPVLLALIRLAGSSGLDAYAWRLAWTLDDFFDRRGRWSDQAASQEAALAAARRLADRAGEGQAHLSLGRVYTRLGRFDEAESHLQRAVAIYDTLEDPIRSARGLHNLAEVAERRGEYAEALAHAEAAYRLCQADGHKVGAAKTLSAIGWYLGQLGQYREALATNRDALRLHQEIGDRHGEAASWDSLGYAHHHLGEFEQALNCFQHALDTCRELGDRYNEAGVLTNLADTRQAQGDRDGALAAWQQAVDILDDLDHPDADRIRQRLAPQR